MAGERKLPAPEANPETISFWQAASAGRLTLRKCTKCARVNWYPRAICPFCFGDTDWVDATGNGTIYSFSVMHRAPEPYTIAFVTLEEGVAMMTNIVDCDFEKIRIGQKVRLVFKPTEGGAPLPMFKPT